MTDERLEELRERGTNYGLWVSEAAELFAEIDRLRTLGKRADGFFAVGDRVVKGGGDYTFEGAVVAVFAKRSGVTRYVVEDDRGLLFIFNENQLQKVASA